MRVSAPLRTAGLLGGWAVLAALTAASARAQDSAATRDSAAAADSAGAAVAPMPGPEEALPAGEPTVTLRTLYERTIFKVDVLTLELRLAGPEAARIRELTEGKKRTDAREDSVARLAMRARHAWALMHFRRGVSLDQFLDGIEKNLWRAQKAGLLDSATVREISAGLPGRYAFLKDRGLKKGDEQVYTIRGDTLRVVYREVGGDVALDTTYVGPERRLSVLGGYLAKDADFRKGLVKSAFGED